MRTIAKLPVQIEGINRKLWTENISEGGCCIVGVSKEDNLTEGKKVILHIKFPHEDEEDKQITLAGIIKYVRGDKAGIEFDKPFKGLLVSAYSIKNTISSISTFARELSTLQKDRAKSFAKKVYDLFSGLKTVIVLFFLLSMFFSVAQHKMLQFERKEMINKIEKQRKTKVITLIHRQESVNFLGIPVRQYIKIEDAEAILRAIRSVPPDKPIDLILHTPGGILLPAYQIARTLKDHKGKVTVFIPHYAMSGGTLIALAADEIVMDKNAVLGPVDPQLIMNKTSMPAVSIIKIPDYKKWSEIEDSTIIMYDQALKSLKQVKTMVSYLLKNQKNLNLIINNLVLGKVTHDYPLFYEDVRKLGLHVSTDMPSNIYKLMDLFGASSKAVIH